MTDDTTTVEHTDDTADADLGDAMFRVAMETTDDGRVIAEITNIVMVDSLRGDPYIEVTFRLPSMRTVTERLDYPETDTPDYKFVRLCERAGYSLASVEQVEGAEIEAEQVDGDWRLYAPEESTRQDWVGDVAGKMMRGGGLVLAVAVLPITVAVMMMLDDDEPGTHFNSHRDMAASWTLVTLVWAWLVWMLLVITGTNPTVPAPVEVPL